MSDEVESDVDSSADELDIGRLDSDLALLEGVKDYLEERRLGKPEREEGRRAWGKFYLRYRRVVKIFIRSCGVSPPDVPDCEQEVWTAVIGHLRSFRHPGNGSYFRGWLYRVVESKAIDITRKRSARRTVSLTDGVVSRNCSANRTRWPDPGARLDEKWRQALVHAALEELGQSRGEQVARVLVLRVVEGRSAEEVGAALHLTPGNVRIIQHRARMELRSILQLYTDEPLV